MQKQQMTITIQHRRKAASIINLLRNQSNRARVAEMIGTSVMYITCTEHMTKRQRGDDELHYVVPPKVIQRVLDWAAADEYRKAVRVVE